MGKSFKRFITLFLALTLIVTGAIPTTSGKAAEKALTKSEAKFKDIEGHKYEKSLNYAVNNGLLTSKTNKINPTKKIKRADVIMAAVALLGATAEKGNMKNVKDVKEGDASFEAFSAAIAAGLIAPNKKGNLYPNYNATNDYVAKIFSRILDIDRDDMRDMIPYKKTMNRARFSKLLRTTFPNIITDDTTKLVKGNVVINTPGVKLSDVKVSGKLIIGEGVGDGEVTLENVEVDGAMFVRTGSAETVSLTEGSTVLTTTIKADELDVADETPAGAPDDETPADDKEEPVYIWIPGDEPAQPTQPPVEPTPTPVVVDPTGRKTPIVANYGTPKLDGVVDDIWSNVEAAQAIVSSGTPGTSATFKVLWDDFALFFLAEVTDPDLNVGSGNVYEKDSVEVYLDENNDSKGGMVADNADDIHFRVNYLNEKSGDAGDINRFSTATKVTENGYIIEGRVAFLNPITDVQDKTCGIEFSVNDGVTGNTRAGTMNVYDPTGQAYANTSLFGKVNLIGKTESSVPGLNIYDLISLVNETKYIELERYTDATANVVKTLLAQADAAIAAAADDAVEDPAQADVDKLLADIQAAVKALVRDNNKIFDEKECLPIPGEYRIPATNGGIIETVEYNTYSYAKDEDGNVVATGDPIAQSMNVYLPYGYDKNDTETKYNVFYLIHGGGENWRTVFGGPGENYALKNILDHMIANGDIEPMIVVTPDQNTAGFSAFYNQLRYDIVPLIDKTYNTIPEREHRATGGFSMGSMCTWYNYFNCIDLFKYFVPCSAGLFGAPEGYDSLAAAVIDVAQKAGYSKEEHYIFNATGTDDMASGGQRDMVNAIKSTPNDSFTYSADLSKGNFYFIDFPGGTHHWTYINRYLYNILPDLFFAENAKAKAAAENMVVANFGTPEVDGVIDEIWNTAAEIKAENVLQAPTATASFKVLWDDNALYLLADVKDADLDATSGQDHEKDSIEFFLDEFNENSGNYDSNDYQLRINYLNQISGTAGIANRVTSKVVVTEGVGYVVEARIEFLGMPKNYKVSGTEFALNDASNGTRIGMLKALGTTDNAYSTTNVFGKMMYMGKKYSDKTQVDLSALKLAVSAAESLTNEMSQIAAVKALLNAGIEECKAALNNAAITKEEVAALAAKLNNIVNAINELQAAYDAATTLDTSAYTAESVAAYEAAIDEIDTALAAASITVDEIKAITGKANSAAGLLELPAIVAKYGTPVLDGVVDEIWNDVTAVPFITSTGNTDTTATVKVMWDDYAYFFLAQVNDAVIDTQSGDAYQKDSVEVYLDELNDSVGGMVADNADDIHFRANVLGALSCDAGDLNRFTASAKEVEGGYVIEGRVSFLSPETTAVNGKVCGAEFSINDAANGSRIATLNVFDKTANAYADTSLFGKVVFEGKTEDSVPGLNIYDLQNYLKEVTVIELERYTEATAKTVSDLVAKANEFIALAQDAEAEDPSQADVDKLLVDLKAAVKALVHDTNKIFDDKECLPIPSEYRVPAEKAGHIETVEYEIKVYSSGQMVKEKMNVYVPYGYDPEDKDTKYNTFYMLHGMNESWTTIFGGEGKNYALKNLLDHMIANGDIEPLILITPDHYTNGMFGSDFDSQLREYVVPEIEARYNVYTDREHRATGGFSMGSNKTWENYESCVDMFKYFVPSSFGFGFGGAYTDRITSIAENSGYNKEDIYIFMSAGTADNLGDSMRATADEIRDGASSFFTYSADLSKGNFYMIHFPGGTHHWTYVNRYLYNILPDLFFAENAKDKAAAENMVIANFGTPKIDGEIDEVWSKAVEVKAENKIDNPQATATFKTLWDDEAIYVLAQVADTDLDSSSWQDHEKDSIEFFLDEYNEKSRYSYDSNDYQLRINYLNQISGTAGIADRVTSEVKVIEGVGYVVEARITFLGLPKNYKVSGTEFSLNDASEGRRIGMLKTLGTTDNAYQDPGVFGNLMYMGKKYDDTTSVDFTGLNKAIDAAKAVDNEVSKTAAVAALLTDCIAEAEAALVNEEITKEAVKALVDKLNALVNAINDIQSALTSATAVDKTMYTADTVAAFETSLAAVETALAAESITADELISLGAALKAAISGLKVYYPEVAPVTAPYGYAMIDGVIAEGEWDSAATFNVYPSSSNPIARATFKVLWDENAFYVLADVNDPVLGSGSSNVYEKDSIEIYLDENYDHVGAYSTDDLHFRVNYKNEQSADDGDLNRFYTVANVKADDSGYIVEARISFLNKATDGKVSGIEFSVNDAQGSSRIGTLNAFDYTGMAYSTVELLNKITFEGTGTPGPNPYDLANLNEEAKEIWLDYYSNGDTVAQLSGKVDELIAKAFDLSQVVTQEEIDALYDELAAAIDALVRNNNYDKGKECRRIPAAYMEAAAVQGTLKEVTYIAHDTDGTEYEKTMNVYLPAGYFDAENADVEYDVFYYVHGMGESQYMAFGYESNPNFFKNVVDNMIANGKLAPMIIVTPTWAGPSGSTDMGQAGSRPGVFNKELYNDIIPCIENNYRTKADGTNSAESRVHRALGGFSAGSMSLWSTYQNNGLDYFKYFVPISGSGSSKDEIAQLASKFANLTDYYIFGASGTEDMANGGLRDLVKSLGDTAQFVYNADLSIGNCYYIELQGGTHIFNCAARYLYNILPDLFFRENDKDFGQIEIVDETE